MLINLRIRSQKTIREINTGNFKKPEKKISEGIANTNKKKNIKIKNSKGISLINKSEEYRLTYL